MFLSCCAVMSIDRERVAACVSIHRGRRGWSQAQLAEAAGVDPKTVNGLERARSWPLTTSQRAIEQALGLEYGSLQRVGEGGEATPIGGQEAAGPLVSGSLMDEIRGLDYLTDDDVSFLQSFWDRSKQAILDNAREINETRASRRRRKGA